MFRIQLGLRVNFEMQFDPGVKYNCSFVSEGKGTYAVFNKTGEAQRLPTDVENVFYTREAHKT